MKQCKLISALLLLLLLVGCGDEGKVMDGDGMFQVFEYNQISQEEAKQMMDREFDWSRVQSFICPAYGSLSAVSLSLPVKRKKGRQL